MKTDGRHFRLFKIPKNVSRMPHGERTFCEQKKNACAPPFRVGLTLRKRCCIINKQLNNSRGIPRRKKDMTVSIKLILDSSADLNALEGVEFAYTPMKIVTAEREFIDNKSGDAAEMVEYLAAYRGRSSTSCPNVEDWLDSFGDAKQILCITITGGLSGSCNAACTAGKLYEEAHPDRRVVIIDSLTAGPEIALMAERARDLAREGLSLNEIAERLGQYRTELIFVLESLRNFANNGRVSKTAAAAAGFLGIRAVGRASDQGTLEMLTKARGEAKALDAVMTYLAGLGYKGGRLAIHHCMADTTVSRLSHMIRNAYPSADITVRRTRCLCSYYAERGGFLVGFEA